MAHEFLHQRLRHVDRGYRASRPRVTALFADTVDPALKYGGGDQSILEVLAKSSHLVAREESLE